MTKISFAQGQIKSFAERVQRLESEIKAMNADKAEIYREAKGFGFDVPALKIAIRKWIKLADDPEAVQELDSLTDLYLSAIQGQIGPDDQETAQERTVSPANSLPEETAPTRAHVREETPIQEPTSSLLSAGDGGPLTNDPETGDLCAGSAVILESKSPDPAEPFPELPAFMDRRPKPKPEYTAEQLLGAG